MKIAFDTNILIYASGINDAIRQNVAINIINDLPQENICLPVQVLGEFFNAYIKRVKGSPLKARNQVLVWCQSYSLIPTSENIMLSAIELAGKHHLSLWDAVILAASASVECDLLLSEDMQDGFSWNGVTVVNPFASPMNPLLQAVLKKYRSRP